MNRIRTILLGFAWAGLVWMLFSRAAGGNGISDVLWINLAYYAIMIFATVVAVVASLLLMNRIFQPPNIILIGTSALVILAMAALDVFWLRGLIVQP